MKKITIGIVDYGFGNISSLYGCLMSLGFSVNVSSKKSVLKKSDILFLPGVGAFDSGMKAMHQKDLVHFIHKFHTSGKTIVGICLGMQLLFSSSDEGSSIKGLCLLPGRITKIKTESTHIGWNRIKILKPRSIFKNFDGKHFYFNHSYSFDGSRKIVSGTSVISAKNEIVSAIIKKRNITGLQFNPEKSQSNGASLLNRIILDAYNA